jgi:hypothetical protein
MPKKNKKRLIYNSEFIGLKKYIKILNNKDIFILDNSDLDIYKIIYLSLNRDF